MFRSIRADELAHYMNEPDDLPYTYLVLRTLPKPSMFVRGPVLVELCGAGFTALVLRATIPPNKFRPSERAFMECLTPRHLQAIAYEAVGREADDADTYNDAKAWSKCLWGKQSSNGRIQTDERSLKRQRTTEDWEKETRGVEMLQLFFGF